MMQKGMIKFTIPLPPITKKNHQRILINRETGKHFIAQSEQYIQYAKDAAWFIPKGQLINVPVNVKCVFYMPTRRKCDLTNLLEAIDDVMVSCGLLTDDSYSVIHSHDGSRVMYCKERPRTEIEIVEVGGT